MTNFDNVPTIPKEEYPLRWEKVQKMMKEQDLDLVFAFSNDSAVYGHAHARWLLNIPTHFEAICVLLGREGDPVLLSGPETDKYALQIGEIKDVRVLWEFSHPDEDYPFSTIYKLKDIVSDIVGDVNNIKKIGIGGKGIMPVDTYNSFEAAIPDANWVDVDNAMCNIRAIKSQAEVDVIKYAYSIAEKGFEAAIKAIKVGVTEREVAAEIESAMRRAGSEGTGIDTIVASGPNSRPILARSTFRKIQANEPIVLTIVPRYEGYHGAIGRMVTIGEPEPIVKKALETASEAQSACYKALEIGKEGREIEAIGRKIVSDAGFGEYFLYSGVHSLGVIEFEAPIFGPSNDNKFEENMIVSVDIPMFNTPWGGLRLEDGYLLTKNGIEKLNNTPYTVVL